MNIENILIGAGFVVAAVAQFQAKGTSLLAWAVLLIAAGLLLPLVS